MNKLISVNYWFGCDWGFYEVGYLGLRAGQLSLACAVVYLWNTGYLRVTRPRLNPGIQHSAMTYIQTQLKVGHWSLLSDNKLTKTHDGLWTGLRQHISFRI